MSRAASPAFMSRRKLYLFLWVGWAMLTFILTSIPNLEFKVPIPGADKLEHLGFYGVMGFFFCLWRRESGASLMRAVVHALLFTALAGALDEVHQYWIPGRFPDPMDWIADAIGGVSGAVFSVLLSRRFPFLITE